MNDITELARRIGVATINAEVQSDDKEMERTRLKSIHGNDNVWDTHCLGERFKVIAFAAPFCIVEDKTTGKKGSVEFQHSPRFYFNFQED